MKINQIIQDLGKKNKLTIINRWFTNAQNAYEFGYEIANRKLEQLPFLAILKLHKCSPVVINIANKGFLDAVDGLSSIYEERQDIVESDFPCNFSIGGIK